MRRRAVIFSFITILLASFFILLFWSTSAPKLDVSVTAAESRIEVMDNYISSWDAYVIDATRLTVRESLTELTRRTDSNDAPVTLAALESNISSCLKTGQANYGNPTGGYSWCFASANSSLAAKLDNFSQMAEEELNIETAYAISPQVQVSDWAPFEIRVSFSISYTLADASDPVFAKWNRSRNYDIIVSAEGLPDPLFKRYGERAMLAGRAQRNITKYAAARDQVNESELVDLISKRQYVENRGLSPTYLQRLAGDISGLPDPLGIAGFETLIDPAHTLVAPANYRNVSFTDHQLFAYQNLSRAYRCPEETVSLDPAKLLPVAYPYGSLYLTQQHWARYNIDATDFRSTCP